MKSFLEEKMRVEEFVEIIGAEFYTGVPDSQLKAFCDYLYKKHGISDRHIIAANEGNAVGLAAGYYLATGKIPVVYMQNSGIGNTVNPVVSLLNDKVYAIPCIFVIGWRGEPGTHDEPQHIYQGEITLELLKTVDIQTFIVDRKTTEEELEQAMLTFKTCLSKGKSVAFIIRKGAFEYIEKVNYQNHYSMSREEIIEDILEVSGEDPVVSTTGKASRELFEIRERRNQGHQYDFLTVGSMGHSSSIAQAIAMFKPQKRVWCIDGDGAALMHMGSLALAGSNNIKNLVHILINNGAHETVGGMPTVAATLDWVGLATACGYDYAVSVSQPEELKSELNKVREREGTILIEVKAALGAREDLGRPTTTPIENRLQFMKGLKH